jgi:hypothetical protein
MNSKILACGGAWKTKDKAVVLLDWEDIMHKAKQMRPGDDNLDLSCTSPVSPPRPLGTALSPPDVWQVSQ